MSTLKVRVTITVHNIRRTPITPNGIYIGRRHPRHGSGYFGSPIRLNRPCPVCDDIHTTPGDTLECYSKHLHGRLHHDPKFRAALHDIPSDAELFCFCAPSACHGDVIASHLNALHASKHARRTLRVMFTQRRPLIAPQTNLRDVGARYYAGDEAFYPYRLTRAGLVLRSTTRPRSFIIEASTGPADPRRWR